MHLGIRLIWPALLALQTVALSAAPAWSATKVSFGQVSPTATIWPAVVATKKGFFAQNGAEPAMVSTGVAPGMQAVSMGIHPGVVVGKKGVKIAADLKGQVVGTSSIKSGSTILLRRVLKAKGLA